MTIKLSTPKSSQSVLQTLAWINKQGFRAVPTHYQSKAAVSREYVTKNYQSPPEDLWKRNNYGIGIVTGPAHNGPVDGDLDCDEAVYFAPRFFPPTPAVFGRKSKPRSHLLYRVDVPSFDKKSFFDPVTNVTILELRGDGGHQTIAPGSVHQDTGEPIEWSDVPFPDVPVINLDALIKAAKMTAIAVLVSRHIWSPGYRNETVKNVSGLLFYLEWPLEQTEQLITAIMEYHDDTDKSRLPTIRATYRRGEAGGRISGAGVLRKQLNDDRVVDRILELAGSPSINVLQEYNDRFAVVNVEGKFRIADLDVAPGEPPTFYQKDDFLALLATDYSDERNDKTDAPIPKTRLWLANPRRRQYRTADFVPGAEDPSFLNLWTGWAIQPVKGICDAWLELQHGVICGGDRKLSNWLLHWFANILREPTNKSLTAPVIIGVEGAGKSLLLAYFGRILGRGFTVVTNDEHIHGKFNKHLASTLLLHSDEALYAGDRRHAGIVRSLITDESRIYEQKGIDARQVKNYLRLALTSNEAHAAPAKPGDRRYTVITMGERKLSDKLRDAVVKEMNTTGPAALHQHLLDMDYDPALPRTNVKNEALLEMKAANFSPLEAWWYERLYEGCALPAYLAWATVPPQIPWPHTVAGPALYASLCIRMRERGARGAVPSDTLVALMLERFVGRRLVRMRRYYNDPQLDNVPQMARHLGDRMSSITQLPDLPACRKAFERYMGQVIEWPEGEDDEPARQDDKPAY